MKKTLLAFLFLVTMVTGVAHAGDITGTGIYQEDNAKLLTNLVRQLQFHSETSANVQGSVLATPNLSIGSTVDTQLLVSSGNFISLDASTNIAVVASRAQATGTICDYLLTYNNNSAVFTITKGTEQSLTRNVELPAVPEGGIPIGAVRVSTGTATQFTFGVEGLDTAAYTVTYRDIYCINSGPSKVDVLGL